MTAYRLAIEQTTQLIQRRANNYRNLVIIVAFVILISISWSIITRTWSPLTGCFFLLPICGLYYTYDNRLLDNWRAQLLDSWAKKQIDFLALVDAINATPTLPKGTVQSMLATLPTAGDLLAEQGVSSSTREAIAALLTTQYACQSDVMASMTATCTIVVVSLIVSVACWMWQPLLGMAAVTGILVVHYWAKGGRLKNMKEKIFRARKKPDFNQERYLEFVDNLS